jgi:hypothetical protein
MKKASVKKNTPVRTAPVQGAPVVKVGQHPVAWKVGTIISTTTLNVRSPLLIVAIDGEKNIQVADAENVMFAKAYPQSYFETYAYKPVSAMDAKSLSATKFTACPYEVNGFNEVDEQGHVLKVSKDSKGAKAERAPASATTTNDADKPLAGWSVNVEAVSGRLNMEIVCGDGLCAQSFVACVPEATSHNMNAVNKSYVWYNYLMGQIDGRDKTFATLITKMTASVRLPIKAGTYTVRLCSSDGKGGVECACSTPFTVAGK